jgi:hypothetical protein
MNDSTTPSTHGAASRRLLIGVSITLGLVILAPVMLSSQDLYSWGRDGLGLAPGWAAFVPVALDAAAAACIGMTIVSSFRRERPGVFELLVWVFAGTSAYAQYTHGLTIRDTAPAAFWAFPMFSLLGPVLLHVTLARVRTWARKDVGEQLDGAAGFGMRWLPGVAFRETLAAWAASRREGISDAARAIAYVRETAALRGLDGPDALRYAFRALDSYNVHAAETWLQARHRSVTQADIDTAQAGRPRPIAAPVSPAPAGAHVDPTEMHRRALAACRTGRERIAYAFSVIGSYDQAAAGKFLAGFDYSPARSELNAVARAATGGGESGQFRTVPAARLNGHAHHLALTGAES